MRIDLIGGVGFECRAAGAVGDKAGTSRGECCSDCRKGDVAVFARRCPVAVVPFDGQNVQFERAKALGPGALSIRRAVWPLAQHVGNQLGASSDTKLGIHS